MLLFWLSLSMNNCGGGWGRGISTTSQRETPGADLGAIESSENCVFPVSLPERELHGHSMAGLSPWV